MSDYVLSCTSTADLSADHYARRDLHVAPFYFEIDGRQYRDGAPDAPSIPAFYEMMAAGAETKTSQVTAGDLEEHFERLIQERGCDILHVSLSSGISGEINSALVAAHEVMAKHPGRTVRVMDSLAASSGYGLLMDEAATARDRGAELDEAVSWLEENRLMLNHWFFSTDLSYYVRGGRISKAAGLVGTALNICPLLDVDGAGRLEPVKKIRSKKRTMRVMVDTMHARARDGDAYSGKCYLCHSACMPDALEVARMVEAEFPKLDGRVEINDIGTTIGSHTGPGTVALFFWGDARS